MNGGAAQEAEGFPTPTAVPSRLKPEIADLIWEDEPTGSGAWWVSRTHSGDLQLFIAPDPLTSSLLCLARSGARPDNYEILVVIGESASGGRDEAMAAAKQAMAAKIANPLADLGRGVVAWRLGRLGLLTLNQLPLALTAFALGAFLGLAVGLFAVSTSLVGWPMLLVGILIGAASGPLLKLLIDRKFKSLLGPWGRFWVATLSAAAGALITAGGLLTLFWA